MLRIHFPSKESEKRSMLLTDRCTTNSSIKLSVRADKIPVKVVSNFPRLDAQGPVSPTGSTSSSSRSVDEEILALRARNKVLSEALSAVKESAAKEMKRRFDLVWFARYRCK